MVSWQLARPARPFRRVAVRCPHGFPAVTEQPAFDPDGTPFPTTYYLTCPWLVAAIARREADGGVREWGERVNADPTLAVSLRDADDEQRRIRPELDAGVAGRRNGGLKCLHAHAAFALARPGYELGERILADAGERWCSDSHCGRADT